MPPKPIRVALPDGENYPNHAAGSWWLANLQMDDALRFAGYDHTFATGRGFRSLTHGRAIFSKAVARVSVGLTLRSGTHPTQH